ncbi:hypothetical protein DL93DRAFT_2095182 [Clavulina sp. PMI_390]|nr:hypothetical protein DL93DRAFT_2095182 [Clavulina sp. PMI_390]
MVIFVPMTEEAVDCATGAAGEGSAESLISPSSRSASTSMGAVELVALEEGPATGVEGWSSCNFARLLRLQRKKSRGSERGGVVCHRQVYQRGRKRDEATRRGWKYGGGQLVAWKRHHQNMCKLFLPFTSSYDFVNAEKHTQLDSLLLSQTIAGHYLPFIDSPQKLASEATLLLSLLPHPDPLPTPPLPKSLNYLTNPISPQENLAKALSSRGTNNHWVVYSSELDPVAHAIYPSASRAFNHSCAPNAIPVYIYGDDHQGPKMQVRALERLEKGDEVTVPYIDPAQPYKVRQDVLMMTYGFVCRCPRCSIDQTLQTKIPRSPDSTSAFVALYPELIRLVFGDFPIPFEGLVELPSLHTRPLPDHLLLLKVDSHLPYLSGRFRDASHDQDHIIANETGNALLALYLTIYPPAYPVVGHHLLEMTKASWNHYLQVFAPDISSAPARDVLIRANVCLKLAEELIPTSQSTGDVLVDGAWESRAAVEMKMLRDLLDAEGR